VRCVLPPFVATTTTKEHTMRSHTKLARRAALLGLPATLAAALLSASSAPAAPGSASEIRRNGTFIELTGTGSTFNDISTFVDQQGRIAVSDSAGLQAGPGCTVVGNVATCGTGVTAVNIDSGSGNDRLTPQAPVFTTFRGGTGDDIFRGGLVRGGASVVTFNGGEGFDTADYSSADRFVTVTLDFFDNDGRPGDADNVDFTVETLVGSRFPDRLTGDSSANVFDGRAGDDRMSGLSGNDVFEEGRFANGADEIFGGLGDDAVVYGARLAAVHVSPDNVADDGAAGEGDDVGSDVEDAHGGAGADTLVGSSAANQLFGNGGDDTLVGLGGDDELFGDAGVDAFSAGGGNDAVTTQDGSAELVKCGKGTDTVRADNSDVLRGCENRI
jgi:Ca2+-binding RTX toxin-like protein